MFKKNKWITTIALITSACASNAGLSSYEQSLENAAAKIPVESQQAYFACNFERHETDCRQKIWSTHPNPKFERDLSRETVRDFFRVVDLHGAGHLLDKQGYKCGTPQNVTGQFWKSGYEVTCADGRQYIVDQENQNWRIMDAPKEQ